MYVATADSPDKVCVVVKQPCVFQGQSKDSGTLKVIDML